jgi:hypothetical protein
MSARAQVTLVPLAAGLHLRWPRFNAAVMRALLVRATPDAVALEPFPPGFAADATWQDHDELLVPWVVVPWARRAGVAVHGVHEPSPDPHAVTDMERYLAAYPAARALLDRIAALERPLPDLLASALTLPRVLDEVVPLLDDVRAARLEAFGDGPANDWSEARAARAAQRVMTIGARDVLLLVPLDRFGSLRDALLAAGAEVRLPQEPPPDEPARERALLDLAWRGDGADTGALVAQLRGLGHAEARYHAAGLLLAHDHLAEALAELEGALRLDFAEPWFLPGSLLARLGQLRDLAGRRPAALRAYRGVLALDWAPRDAVSAARDGIAAPFERAPPSAGR